MRLSDSERIGKRLMELRAKVEVLEQGAVHPIYIDGIAFKVNSYLYNQIRKSLILHLHAEIEEIEDMLLANGYAVR